MVGEELDTTATCEMEGIINTTPTVTWTPAANIKDGKATNNTTYTASVTLTPDADWYAFAENVTATVNGQNATSVTKKP